MGYMEINEMGNKINKGYKCSMEGCLGIATENLIITDDETQTDINVCINCWSEHEN